MNLRKKAQVGGLQGFILSIITVAVVLAVGLIVLAEMKDVAKEIEPASVILNETVTIVQSGDLGTGALAQHSLFIGASACRNASVNEEVINLGSIGSAHWNCSVNTGTVTVNVSVVNTTSVRIDYTHFTASGAFNSTGSIITKLATVPTWIGVIIIIALAFIVLSFFIGKRQ